MTKKKASLVRNIFYSGVLTTAVYLGTSYLARNFQEITPLEYYVGRPLDWSVTLIPRAKELEKIEALISEFNTNYASKYRHEVDLKNDEERMSKTSKLNRSVRHKLSENICHHQIEIARYEDLLTPIIEELRFYHQSFQPQEYRAKSLSELTEKVYSITGRQSHEFEATAVTRKRTGHDFEKGMGRAGFYATNTPAPKGTSVKNPVSLQAVVMETSQAAGVYVRMSVENRRVRATRENQHVRDYRVTLPDKITASELPLAAKVAVLELELRNNHVSVVPEIDPSRDGRPSIEPLTPEQRRHSNQLVKDPLTMTFDRMGEVLRNDPVMKGIVTGVKIGLALIPCSAPSIPGLQEVLTEEQRENVDSGLPKNFGLDPNTGREAKSGPKKDSDDQDRKIRPGPPPVMEYRPKPI